MGRATEEDGKESGSEGPRAQAQDCQAWIMESSEGLRLEINEAHSQSNSRQSSASLRIFSFRDPPALMPCGSVSSSSHIMTNLSAALPYCGDLDAARKARDSPAVRYVINLVGMRLAVNVHNGLDVKHIP